MLLVVFTSNYNHRYKTELPPPPLYLYSAKSIFPQARWSFKLEGYNHVENEKLIYEVLDDKDLVQHVLINRVEAGYWRPLTAFTHLPAPTVIYPTNLMAIWGVEGSEGGEDGKGGGEGQGGEEQDGEEAPKEVSASALPSIPMMET